MVGGVIKYFRFSWDYVLWEISFTNLNMLLATIPVYDEDDKEDKKKAGSEETTLEDIFKDEM